MNGLALGVGGAPTLDGRVALAVGAAEPVPETVPVTRGMKKDSVLAVLVAEVLAAGVLVGAVLGVGLARMTVLKIVVVNWTVIVVSVEVDWEAPRSAKVAKMMNAKSCILVL